MTIISVLQGKKTRCNSVLWWVGYTGIESTTATTSEIRDIQLNRKFSLQVLLHVDSITAWMWPQVEQA